MADSGAKRTYKILYGDDDPDMQTLVKLILHRAGLEVVAVGNGQEVMDAWRRDHFDGVVLDVTMPLIDGLEICRRIRRLSQVPILLLTGRGQEEEVVLGLEAGADDYIVKPIRQKEFLARIQVALKRTERMSKGEEELIRVQDLVIYPRRRLVTLCGRPIPLTPLEYQILVYLARKPGTAIPKKELFDNVWGYSTSMADGFVDLNIVESAIRRLRRKLTKDAAKPDLIQTVRGLGYQLSHL
ncbi:MAG: response regulator transcription factor [Anaerolineales bacterium]